MIVDFVGRSLVSSTLLGSVQCSVGFIDNDVDIPAILRIARKAETDSCAQVGATHIELRSFD